LGTGRIKAAPFLFFVMEKIRPAFWMGSRGEACFFAQMPLRLARAGK
jgi:hypothetical protein